MYGKATFTLFSGHSIWWLFHWFTLNINRKNGRDMGFFFFPFLQSWIIIRSQNYPTELMVTVAVKVFMFWGLTNRKVRMGLWKQRVRLERKCVKTSFLVQVRAPSQKCVLGMLSALNRALSWGSAVNPLCINKLALGTVWEMSKSGLLRTQI